MNYTMGNYESDLGAEHGHGTLQHAHSPLRRAAARHPATLRTAALRPTALRTAALCAGIPAPGRHSASKGGPVVAVRLAAPRVQGAGCRVKGVGCRAGGLGCSA